MPIIAVVGGNNEAQYMMQSYLEALTALQLKYKPKADSYLKTREDDSEAELPTFKITPFTDKDELFDWISSDDYTYPDGNTGVCYGFQMEEDDDKGYTLTLFFNDQTSGGE